MEFRPPLLRGRLVTRYKRFFAEVDLDDGRRIVAHCANPGSMQTCVETGAIVWVREADGRRRKLRYTWELVDLSGALIYVNPSGANALVLEAIKRGVIAELSGYAIVEREIRFNSSRIDFRLRGPGECYVEVKNVTMRLRAGTAAFPDSVTARGTKHLKELMELRRSGRRAMLLFCVSRTDAVRVVPADEIDPLYGNTLREAEEAGVELVAYGADISTSAIQLTRRVPVVLPRL